MRKPKYRRDDGTFIRGEPNGFAICLPTKKEKRYYLSMARKMCRILNIPVPEITIEHGYLWESSYFHSLNKSVYLNLYHSKSLAEHKYFKRKFAQHSYYNIDPVLFALAHELVHFKQDFDGIMELKQSRSGYSMQFWWRGVWTPHNSTKVSYANLPWERHANKYAFEVMKTLWRMERGY